MSRHFIEFRQFRIERFAHKIKYQQKSCGYVPFCIKWQLDFIINREYKKMKRSEAHTPQRIIGCGNTRTRYEEREKKRIVDEWQKKSVLNWKLSLNNAQNGFLKCFSLVRFISASLSNSIVQHRDVVVFVVIIIVLCFFFALSFYLFVVNSCFSFSLRHHLHMALCSMNIVHIHRFFFPCLVNAHFYLLFISL